LTQLQRRKALRPVKDEQGQIRLKKLGIRDGDTEGGEFDKGEPVKGEGNNDAMQRPQD